MYSLIQTASDKLEGQASVLKEEFKILPMFLFLNSKQIFMKKFEEFVDDIHLNSPTHS